MTPNFALNMSEDGIALLHRVPDGTGWAVVGRASLNAADLARDMHALRDIAVSIEDANFATKLILPPSQLLYADIPVGDNIARDIGAALEGMTPYKRDKIVYDTNIRGDVAQVVAVAAHTLDEARDFVAPYKLNPVGFTAIPKPAHFKGEPNLGPVAKGANQKFTPDSVPIQIVKAPKAKITQDKPAQAKPALAKPVVKSKPPAKPAKPKPKIDHIAALAVKEAKPAFRPSARYMSLFFAGFVTVTGPISVIAFSDYSIAQLFGAGPRDAIEYPTPGQDIPDPVSPDSNPDARAQSSTDTTPGDLPGTSDIWQNAPQMTAPVRNDTLDRLYLPVLGNLASLRDVPEFPPVHPDMAAMSFTMPLSPPPPDANLEIDDQGLVRAQPGGAISPDGVMVFQGTPPAPAAPNPTRLNQAAQIPDERLALVRPPSKPQNDIAQPTTPQAAPLVFEGATQRAVAQSRRPVTKPQDFAQIVARARPAAPQNTGSASTAAINRGPAVAPASRAKPSGRTRTAVARAATQNNAINLRNVTLLGISGSRSRPRALVRLPSGRTAIVTVGDDLNGGRVAAIGNGSLKYVRNGETLTLSMP